VKLWQQFYLTPRFYWVFLVAIALLVNGFWWPPAYWLGLAAGSLSLGITAGEAFWLFGRGPLLFARRQCRDRFSNGDDNPVDLYLENLRPQNLELRIIDELPPQFQRRDFQEFLALPPYAEKMLRYQLKPRKRGPYRFGALQVFVSAFAGMCSRRLSFHPEGQEVAVYPSFVQMRQYELLAISQQLQVRGLKKVRPSGLSREFEQIERYVSGDDYRRINWKATARKNSLMVNHYQDERSQNLISAIDKGRAMKMPFAQMTLLDYAINASLVLSNIALRKGDRAGLCTFQDRVEGEVLPEARSGQLLRIMEQLYREKTSFRESDLQSLYRWLRTRVNQRSLVLLYTNFESLVSMRRQQRALRLIGKQHLLLVVIFINTELEAVQRQKAQKPEDIYVKALAENLSLEKEQMQVELQQQGIQCLLTRPQELNARLINRYLELKGRGLL